MAHILRLRLHALCSSRLSSSASASKLLMSPGLRLTTWRCYGEGVLLEDQFNLNNESDGGSMGTNQGDSLARQSEGMQGGTEKKDPVTIGTCSFKVEDHLELSLGMLTRLVPDESDVKLSLVHDEKAHTSQSQADNLLSEGSSSQSATDSKWKLLVNNMRVMAVKKTAKAGDASSSGSSKAANQLKTEKPQSRQQQSGASERPSMSNMRPPRNTEIQSGNQQKSFLAQSMNQPNNSSAQSSSPLNNSPALSSNQQELKHPSKAKRFSCSFEYLKSLSLEEALRELDAKENDESKGSPKILSDKFTDETTSDDLNNWSSAIDELFAGESETSKEMVDKLFTGDSEMLKETLPLSSVNSPSSSFGVNSKHGGSQYKNPEGSNDALSKTGGKGSSFLRTPSANNGQVQNQQANLVDNIFAFGTKDATHQPKSNDTVASKKAYMICVQNLPPTCNPSVIRVSMANYGEVTGLFKKPILNDKLCVYVQFKTADAMESAVAAKKLQLGNRTCFITRADHSAFSSVVRVSRASTNMDESKLRAVCVNYGKVDDIKKRAPGVFDVFYDVKELDNIASIMTSLNEVKLDRQTWNASPAPTVHPSMQNQVFKTPEGLLWHEAQVSQALNRFEGALDMVCVIFEDLKEIALAAPLFVRSAEQC